jgi:hypothetical protein
MMPCSETYASRPWSHRTSGGRPGPAACAASTTQALPTLTAAMCGGPWPPAFGLAAQLSKITWLARHLPGAQNVQIRTAHASSDHSARSTRLALARVRLLVRQAQHSGRAAHRPGRYGRRTIHAHRSAGTGKSDAGRWLLVWLFDFTAATAGPASAALLLVQLPMSGLRRARRCCFKFCASTVSDVRKHRSPTGPRTSSTFDALRSLTPLPRMRAQLA